MKKLTLFIVSFLFIQKVIFAQITCLEGDSLMQQQKFVQAAEAYSTCLNADTSDQNIRYDLANCLFLLGDFPQATVHFLALEQKGNSEAVLKLASIYEMQQQLPKAIKYYLLAHEAYPENPTYLRKLGALYLQGGSKKQGQRYFEKALELNSRDLISLQNMSEIHFSHDSIAIADSFTTVGLAIDSAHFGLSLIKSRTRYKMKDYPEVCKILLGLTMQTELSMLHTNILAFSLIQIDSLDKAIFFLNRALSTIGKHEITNYYLGLAYEKKKDYAGAIYYYQQAAEAGISENMNNYHNSIARIHSETKNFKTAIQQYQKSLEYKDDPLLYFYMANAAELGYTDKNRALKYYQQFLKSDTKDKDKITFAQERVKIIKEYNFMKN